MKTFKELRAYGMELFKGLSAVQAENEKRLAKLKEMKIYTNEYMLENQKKANDEFLKAVKVASVQFTQAVKDTVSAKRTAINKMIATPPTVGQMNLLNSLQLQGNSLNEAEVRSIAAQLMGNYQAMHTLQVMAGKAGIRIHYPPEYDYTQLNEALNHAESYLKDRIHALTTYNGNSRGWDFHSKSFFDVWGGGENHALPEYSEFAAQLDANEQTAPEVSVEKRTLTAAETTAVESLFSGNDPETAMNMVIASPELRSLVSLHPEYGKLLK